MKLTVVEDNFTVKIFPDTGNARTIHGLRVEVPTGIIADDDTIKWDAAAQMLRWEEGGGGTITVSQITDATIAPGANLAGTHSGTSSGTNTGDQSLAGLVPNTRTVNGQALSSDVTLDADDVGAPAGSGTSTGSNTGDQDLSGLVPTSRTVNGHPLSANVTVTASDVGAPAGSGTSTGTNTGDQTVLAPRVQTAADGNSITPNASTDDAVKQINTQAAGTLTINNPTGSPAPLQLLRIRIKSTNAQTLAFGAQFRGSTVQTLPGSTSGGGKTDYFIFSWNADDSRWDIQGENVGF